MLTDWPLSQGGLTLPKSEIKMIERIQKMQTQQYKKKPNYIYQNRRPDLLLTKLKKHPHLTKKVRFNIFQHFPAVLQEILIFSKDMGQLMSDEFCLQYITSVLESL